jgi:mono/diheme cytochrome c family protein
MATSNPRSPLPSARFFALLIVFGIVVTARFLPAQSPAAKPEPLAASFEASVKPFFKQNCMTCHNSNVGTAGIRVDQLDATLEDRQIPMWEAIRRRLREGSMPPKGLPQPSAADRQRVVDWIGTALEVARLRPAPMNGLVRRLTVAQYRNTLRELLLLDDDLTGGLPPDAVSKDGFLNNKDTLQLSPLLTESYFEIAETALNRCIVDLKRKPSIQDFRVELGSGINPAPLGEKLVLGADSMLLDNPDFVVTQVTPVKPFVFEPFIMRTKYRFIEGYRGNDTVRGWRDYDSIYHAVFADMRGARGYPKGNPYDLVPQGLLLRPAIPSDEIFGSDGTYGPKANFKISVRQLPDDGRFRVTVTAAKYNDGLLLDKGAPPQTGDGIVWQSPKASGKVTIPKSGVYQVDTYLPPTPSPVLDPSRLDDGLTGSYPRDTSAAARLEGKAHVIDSPAGKALSFAGGSDACVIPRSALPTNDAANIGEGDFTVSAWVHPSQLRRAGLLSLGDANRMQGWYLDLSDERGGIRFQMVGQNDELIGQFSSTVSSRGGVIRAGAWQHVAVVVRRGRNETRIYVNGYPVARSQTGTSRFDDPAADFQIGHIPGSQPFRGDLADIRLYRRPLDDGEILGLVQPHKDLVPKTPESKQNLTLTLGDRQFSAALQQPAFVVVRLEAGALPVGIKYSGAQDLDRIIFTPLRPDQDLTKRFLVFEKRLPRVGVHLGLRRDCGSTLAPVGAPQTVASEKLTRFVFEGAIRNFPSPEVEKDNVNYLAGVREIGVRSEYTDGRDMPRLLIRSVEFEGPFYESWPPRSHRNIFVDFDRKNDLPAYARKVIHDFATRAYRRPITTAEEAGLMAVYTKSVSSGCTFEESIKDALLVVLTAPQFLFLVETSNTPAAEPLDNYELASKLSYFLWNGPPDRKTLQLAAEGALRKDLNAEVTRMILDPRFSRFTHEFTSQWLSLDKFQVLDPDRKLYPKLTRDARTQLKQEPVEFLQYLIRENLPVRDLIQSDFVVADEVVADYYGLGERTESGFEFVPIRHERPELGGLLTQAAIMAGLSDGRESNPVKRGAWVARKIISEPPADPPPNVPALKPETAGLTLRQRLEQHRSQTGCMQCHSKIDPWGVALEEFDAGGRRKTTPVDAKSTLPDKTQVSGTNDLKRYLAQDRIDQVAFSFLKHLATYATGRTLTYNELMYLKQDELRLKASGYRMQDMVRYVASSKMFLEK